MTDRRLLAITGGHRYDAPAFTAMLDAVCGALGWTYEHAEHPDPRARLRPELADEFDAVLLHDLPGLRLARGAEPEPIEPTAEERTGAMALLETGIGVVATHHALAGWPAWDEWAGALGGRFLYAPGTLRGVTLPASGYRFGAYTVESAGDHPVTAGVEPFELVDELYLCPVFEDEVTPLLATPAEVSPASMIDTYCEVVDGVQVPAHDQPGSRLLGWCRLAARSRLVYLLPGHTAETMTHPTYRRLITNALAWVTDS